MNKDTRTENDIIIQSEVKGVTTSDTEEMLFDDMNIKHEIMYLDKVVLQNNFSGRTLAGEPVVYRWNNWGSLDVRLQGIKLKSQTKGHIMSELYTEYFTIYDVVDHDHQWCEYIGILFKDSAKPIEGKFLLRGNKVIGYFKPKKSVMKTIKFYERKVYAGVSRHMHKSHKTVDFRKHTPHGVYDHQEPEFTQEDTLEEVRAFLASLKSRVLGNEEKELVREIYSEVGLLVD